MIKNPYPPDKLRGVLDNRLDWDRVDITGDGDDPCKFMDGSDGDVEVIENPGYTIVQVNERYLGQPILLNNFKTALEQALADTTENPIRVMPKNRGKFRVYIVVNPQDTKRAAQY